jgi:hypothetical protein
MNAEGVILASGNSEGVGYVNAPISTGSEIPGCTDPNACNFNPEATCDAGNCLSICSGCTDSNALNFNADASFNDGSCVYQMESPTLGINVETIVEENEYYVIASVLNLGNGAPYIFSAQNSDLMTVINSNGQYVLGPFPCGEAVVVTLHSTTLGMMQTMESNPLNGNCLLSTSEGEIKGEQSILLYPNPAENEITIAGINESFMKLTIMDLTGRIVFEQQNYFQQNVSLDVSDLVPGMYLLSIQTADDMISETFVVKR